MTETNIPIAKKNRSVAYPFVDLEQAIELMEKLTRSTGKGPYSRDTVSIGIGHPRVTGTSSMKVATLVHFGLLSRSGNVYSRTELTDRIQIPVSEDDWKLAINEAVNMPKLYKAIIEKYKDQSLPTLLGNILVREFGINENVVKDVERNFKKSLEFTGLLTNGVLHGQHIDQEIESPRSVSVENLPSQEINLRQTSSPHPNIYEVEENYPVELEGGIVVIFPKKFMRDVTKGKFSEGVDKLEEKARELQKIQNFDSESQSE